jgi:diadenosine tetraphosphate (Ap4A) HIT family hydrolase
MTTTLEEFREAFRLDELEIVSTEHWVWSLRPVPATLGAGVLSLRREATRLRDLTDDEGADLVRAVRLVEPALVHAFAPDKLNYLMLMMVDAHVHYHVLPRYAEQRQFAGLDWVDSGWPGQPNIAANTELADDVTVLNAVRDELRAATTG